MPKPTGLNFATVLMAGGASTRMGQAKAFLDYRGLPLWRFQANKLLGLQPDEQFLSAPQQLQFEEGPWKIIHDQQPGLGPLAGLDAVLQIMAADWLVVLAVDMPNVTTEFLQLLLREAGEGGVVPVCDHFYQGLVAIYPRAIHPLVKEVLSSEDRSFQHLVRKAMEAGLVRIHLVKEAEHELFRNLNSPSDL